MENFSPAETEILSRYVTNTGDNIYVIFNLPPEVIAVLFAYVSRSPNSFRQNLIKLIQQKDLNLTEAKATENVHAPDFSEAREKAKKFHERWVVGYGHNSVAEHAVASVAIEDVSILATKIIEDNRLASYTEKSTRYQIFDKTRYYKPKKILESGHARLYTETMDFLFDEYSRIVLDLIGFVKKKHPRQEGETDSAYENISKARACDIARYILPAGTLTNLGMTANARVYENAIKKCLSCDLDELKDIGEKIKGEVQKVIPTLVKYAEKNDYFYETNRAMPKEIPPVQDHGKDRSEVILCDFDKDAYERVISAIIYRYGHAPLDAIQEKVRSMDMASKEKVLAGYLDRMGRHDYPMRELEHTYYTFDILVDYGAFRDIQRHRMCTQTNQDLTAEHGYSIPEEIIESGFEKRYRECMTKAQAAYAAISKELPKEAQYAVPLAFRKRVLITWNLRELYHFIRLRSSREGHISYREVAWKCYDEVCRVHPLFGKYLKVDKSKGPSR